MTAILSTKELDRDAKVKKTVKNDAYNEILKECYSKVKTRNRLGYKTIEYKIPSILFGYPLYDINDLATFIIRKLQKGGFTVYVMQGSTSLLISWEKQKPKPVPKQPQVITGRKENVNEKRVHFNLESVQDRGKLSRRDIERKIRDYRNQF